MIVAQGTELLAQLNRIADELYELIPKLDNIDDPPEDGDVTSAGTFVFEAMGDVSQAIDRIARVLQDQE